MRRTHARGVAAFLLGALAAPSCARPAARSHNVTIQNFVFVPATLTVAPGDTVVWTNTDFVEHSATARDSSWDSQAIPANGTWRLVAGTPGRQAYYCVLHPVMQGTLVVR